MASGYVFDVTTPDFETKVLRKSVEVPILLDFWAEWCGPCRTLGPTLEKVAEEYGGAFLVGKVDTEREADLAYAFQVRGIPFCVLMVKGRPVDAFTGALAEKELRLFLGHNGVQPKAGKPKDEDKPAAPSGPVADLRAARLALVQKEFAQAEAALARIPDEDDASGERDRVRAGMAWLRDELPPAPRPAARDQLLAARERFFARDLNGAMECLLQSVGADKSYADGLARRAMLVCFSVAGEDSELTESFRRRLATMLY
ncbi:MAG: tetratricopeptide repeat protein [Planctomycetes bacterium]|nr:tetratricopeptide repeat protein [Planctomycetota bacterium]